MLYPEMSSLNKVYTQLLPRKQGNICLIPIRRQELFIIIYPDSCLLHVISCLESYLLFRISCLNYSCHDNFDGFIRIFENFHGSVCREV